MNGLAIQRPQGDKPPRYIYKARRGGLGGFSRLRNHSRGVHPTAGQQRRINQSKAKNAKAQDNLAENISIHSEFTSPSHRGVINHPATFTNPANAD